jgi:hypothetical protein
LPYNIPKGSKFWNIEEISTTNINDDNYSGIGLSEYYLKVILNDDENIFFIN